MPCPVAEGSHTAPSIEVIDPQIGSCSNRERNPASLDIFSDAESESQSKFDCQPVRRRSWSKATTQGLAEEKTLLVSRTSTSNIGAKYVSGTFVTL